MFERLKRIAKRISDAVQLPDDEPESVDHPRPRRNNPNPPQRDWFARVKERSSAADDPQLTPEAARQVDDLLARAGAPPRARGTR